MSPTFVDALMFQARVWPQKPALILADRVATYAMMAQGVLRVEARIRALGLPPGALVCVVVQSPIRHMIVAAALFRLGHPVIGAGNITVVLPLGLPIGLFLQDIGTDIIPGLRQAFVGDDWFAGEDRPLPLGPPPGFPDESAICRVDVSSGSTGLPKVAGQSVRAFQQRIDLYSTVGSLGDWERMMCVPKLHGGWGFRLAAHVFQSGKTLLCADTPRATLNMCSIYGVDLIVASTQHARDMLIEQRADPIPCPSLRLLSLGGSLLTRALLLEARARICRGITNSYATSEMGFLTFASTDSLMEAEGATGYVVPGVNLEIVDARGEPTPFDTEGEVRVRTPWASEPYPRGVGAHEGFRNGWFYPGDRGRMRSDGLLILTGRTSEIINSGGFKIAPELAEELLLQHSSVAEAAAFGAMGADGLEEICFAVVAKTQIDEKQVIAWCAARQLRVLRVFLVESLPKTEAGKIRREELKKALTV